MNEIIYVPFSEDDDYNEQLEDLGIDTEIALEDAESIVKKSRLGISRENKLSGVLVDTIKKEVVGTLWINSQSITDHEFNFDVAIHPNYRGRGLAEVLIKAMIEEYRDYNSTYQDMYNKRLPIMITVINPLLINVLKRHGFRVDKQGSDRVYMTHDTLTESPDGVKSKSPRIRTNFTNPDAIPFGYIDGVMQIGDVGKKQAHDDMLGGKYVREDFDYAGRLWTTKRVISFWQYPEDKNTFNKVIQDLNKYSEINIDDTWLIEIPTAESWFHDDAETYLIPLKDFYLYDMSSIKKFKNKPHAKADYEWQQMGGKKPTVHNMAYKHSRIPKDISPAEYNYKKQMGVAENEDLLDIINEEVRNQYILNEKNVGKRKILQRINESTFQGKTLVSVDIQPEYMNSINFNLYDWGEFINTNAENNRLVFLYNGDSMGMVSEGEYINWLFELGVEGDVLDNIVFFDKGYAFFRSCMDSNIDEDSITDFVRFMFDNDITNSRNVDEDMWNEYMETTQHNQNDIRELLEHESEVLYLPELMDFIQPYNNIVVFGGGINECLKEVEIALLALNKNYDILNNYTF